MPTLCPRCLEHVAKLKEFKPADGKTNTWECPNCHKQDIPYRYMEHYLKFPPMPVSVLGCTGHGKSRFLDALYEELHRVGRLWRGFAPEDVDVSGYHRMAKRRNDWKGQRAGDFTDPDFPVPQIMRLNGVPRVGNCQLIIFDTGGEVFLDPALIKTKGRYLGKSAGVVWLASLREPNELHGPLCWEPEERFLEVITAYSDAMAQQQIDAKQQTMIFTLSKGERLRVVEEMPDSVASVLDGNLADDRLGDPWDRLEKLSNDLREWLLNNTYHNLVNLLETKFRKVHYCVISAQGREIEHLTPDENDEPPPERDEEEQEAFDPQAVLAPLYWLWRTERPGVWVKHPTGRRYFPSLAAAVNAAMPGNAVILEEGKHVIDGAIEIRKPLKIQGRGRNRTFVSGVGKQFLLGVAVPGQVSIEHCTLDGREMEDGDVLKVLQGQLTLTGCRFRNARAEHGNAWGGRGVLVGGESELTVSDCEFHKNARAGLLISGPIRSTLSQCRGVENQIGMELGESAEVSASDNVWQQNQTGVLVRDAARLTSERDTTTGSAGHGIVVRNTAQFKGSDLKVTINEQIGISLEHEAVAHVSDSRLERNGTGLQVEGSAAMTLSRCTIEENRGDGCSFTGETLGRIDECRFQANQKSGLHLAGKASVSGGGNQGRTNRISDLEIEKSVPSSQKLEGFDKVVDRRRWWS